MTNVTLPVIKLRPYQQEIYQKVVNEGCKRVICVWSRRAGKDILLLNIIAALAIKEKGTYAYFLPTYTQAKKVIWKSISNDGRSMLDMALPKELISKKNDSDMSVTLINGSIIQFLGAESVDRIVGTNYKFVVFSEAALMDERPWSLIRPILMANKGGAAFISTPRSRNWFYDMWIRAREDANWVTSLKTCYDTGVATEEDIEKERKEGMPESLIKQEYFCDFTAANEGSYYGQEIQKMREDGRISDFPIDDAIPVSTTFDLGISDATAIVFYQQIGDWVYVIDYYESNGQSLKDYARVLKEKGYMYGTHHLPHDAKQRDLSTGISRLEFFREMGITNVETIPVKPITYGIECVHRLFPKCKIHSTNCQKLIKCLEMYRKEYDEKNNVFKDKPVHDFASHGCDSFRYLGEVIREETNAKLGSIMQIPMQGTYNPFKWS